MYEHLIYITFIVLGTKEATQEVYINSEDLPVYLESENNHYSM